MRLVTRYVLVVLPIFVFFSMVQHCFGEEQLEEFHVYCRVEVGGEMKNYIIPILLDHPGPPEVTTNNGTAFYYTVNAANRDPAHVNCEDEKYSYAKINLNANWSQSFDVGGGVFVNFTKAHNVAYWDWVYEGYTQVGPIIDYSTNCHGYAFDVGDWPDTAVGIVRWNMSAPTCYTPLASADLDQATFAVDPEMHSLQVTGMKCDHPTIPILKIPKYKTSSEQFRESGIYEQTGVCPDGINIGKQWTTAKWGWRYPNGLPSISFTPAN